MKTIIITGASSGLGRAIALECGRRGGHQIILSGRNEDELYRVREELNTLSFTVAQVVVGDLYEPRTIQMLSEAGRKWNVEILINNAGQYENGLLEDHTVARIEELVQTNLIAPILLTRAVFSIMKAKRAGAIMNINSLAGQNPGPHESVYAATKHGLRGFSRSLRLEAADFNISVTDVYTGALNTKMSAGRKPLEKCIRVTDAAAMIMDLAAARPSFHIDEIELTRRIR